MKLILTLLLIGPVIFGFSLSEEELFSEAENHYRAGNYLLALDIYDEFTANYPLSDRVPDAHYRRAVCNFRLKDYIEAIAIFNEIEKRFHSTRYYDYISFWKGISYYRTSNYFESIDSLTVFLSRVSDPEMTPQSLLYKGLAEIYLKDYINASASLETLIKEYPDSPQSAYGLILLIYACLNEEAYDKILDISEDTNAGDLPDKWRDRYNLYVAEALWEKGNLRESEIMYRELLDSDPDIASIAFRRLFQAAQKKKNLSEMESLIQQAEQRLIEAPEVLEDLWVRVGIESFKQGNLELSEYFLTRVWNRPDKQHISQAVPLYLAEIMIKNDKLKEAELILDDYLSFNPPDTSFSLMRLGDIRIMMDDYERADSSYARYMEEYPDSERYTEAGYMRAYSHYRLGKWDPALELLARLIEDSGLSFRQELMRLEVIIHKKSGNLREAARLLREYKAYFPHDLRTRIDFIKTLFVLKSFREIIEETDLLIQEFPELHEQDLYVYLISYYLRGLSQISVKNYDDALSSLSVINLKQAEAENLSLILPYSLYYQAWALYRNRRYREARTRLISLVEQFPTHSLFPQALFLAGWCSFTLKEYKAAVPYFARLAKMNGKDSAKAAFLQGKSLLNINELKEASIVFHNLLQYNPSSSFADDALFEYAGTMAGLGETDRAAASYRDLTRRYPESPLTEEAMYKRGEVYWAVGDFNKAKNAYFEYRGQYPKGRLVDSALYWGGLSAFELGEKFEAVLHWEKLIDIYRESPFRADALKRTADMYADRGEYRKALNILISMINEYPEESHAAGVENRADEIRYLLLGLSDREAALSSIIGREGGAESVKGREAMIELSRLYIFEGSTRIDLAFQMLSKIIEKDDVNTGARAQYLIGEYYYRKSELIRAAGEFLKAAFLNPKDRDLMAASMFRAAEMMQIAGKPRDVRELVQRLEQHFPESQWTVEGKKLLEE